MPVVNPRNIRQMIIFGSECSWESWNGSMVHFFGEEPIAMLPEDSWQEVANTIISLPTFSVYGPPDPELFDSWQEWANDFTLAVNGPTR